MHERMSVSRQPEPEKVVFLEQSRAAFDRWEGFARSRAGLAVLFVWALAEATVWPIIPGALLVPRGGGARRAFPRLWLAAVTGSTLGGVALYLFALQAPGVALDLLKQLPAVRAAGVLDTAVDRDSRKDLRGPGRRPGPGPLARHANIHRRAGLSHGGEWRRVRPAGVAAAALSAGLLPPPGSGLLGSLRLRLVGDADVGGCPTGGDR